MGLLVFDIGGSAVKYGYWDGTQLKGKSQFKTPITWSAMKDELQQVKETLASEYLIEGVGFSAPGVVNADKRQINGISAVPYIHNFDIYNELEEIFNVPVAIENDANCAGMAEFYEGAGKEFTNVAFVVIGTGVGGALFTEGKLTRGAHLYGGEFGMMFLDKDKTFSELGTAVQMAWRYSERKNLPKDAYTGKEVFDLAEAGDSLAQEEVENFYNYLTKGLFNIQFSFDPDILVLGGGISAKAGLVEEVNRRMSKLLDKAGLHDFIPDIRLCDYRNDANLIGAAANYNAVYQSERAEV